MADFEIPLDLIDMIMQRRIIPFVGAGFSAPLKLPGWDEMLGKLAAELDDSLSYQQIRDFCNNDPLQIAEYLFLRSDRSIGPLRHRISIELQTAANPLLSPAHVELINLGASQIYTTNYDDLIEQTFRGLDVPFNVVALPKHVASSDNRKAQIVKYHGDLRHEATLVLTESSYYTRLDFESPMDLKFRSDLLGRSVLFMGYSFRDINIRIIWFKLMRMMKDIPPNDRPRSYIVRFDHNPVLETLYDAVGLKTIVLDPSGKATSDAEKNALFGRFMLELTVRAAPKGIIPGQSKPMFASTALIEAIAAEADPKMSRSLTRAPRQRSLLSQLVQRQIPAPLAPAASELLLGVARQRRSLEPVELALKFVKIFGAHPGVTLAIATGLGTYHGRELILTSGALPWRDIWGATLAPSDCLLLVRTLKREIDNHKTGDAPDDDIAFAADIVGRIANGEIGPLDDANVIQSSKNALEQAAQLYPWIASYRPPRGEPPAVQPLLDLLSQRREELEAAAPAEERTFTDDDIPF